MRDRRRSQAGFTIMEVVVALFVLAVVLVGMLAIFDASNRVARTQVNIADMQQSLRIGHDEMVRMARMAARGWVISETSWKPEDQIKIWADNAGPAVYISATDPETKVEPGTDVLRIRGVIVGSMFEIDVKQEASCAHPVAPVPGMVSGCSIGSNDQEIKDISRAGLKQDLDQLQRAKDDGNDFTVLVVSKQGEVGLADATVSDIDKTGNTITKASIEIDTSSSDEKWVENLAEHPITMIGIVEEYAFYIRENDGKPRLSMARFKPGTTDKPYGDLDENLKQDIADDIIDLQVALGIDKYTDTNLDGVIDALDKGDGVISADEWFYAGVAGVGAPPVIGTQGDMQLVRIDTLARTQGRDFQYVSKPITRIENHIYDESTLDVVERSYRRRLLQTVLNLRNM